MKKTFLLTAGLAMLSLMSWGQTKSSAFCFIQADGTEIPDGTTVEVSAVKNSRYEGDYIDSGISIKNKSGKDGGCAVGFQIKELPSGSIGICFNGRCKSYETPTDVAATATQPAASGHPIALETKWVLGSKQKGTALVKVSLQDVEITGRDNFTVKQEGPSITIKFVYGDATAVEYIAHSDKPSYRVSNLNGIVLMQTTDKPVLTGLQKGIYIVEIIRNGKVTAIKKIINN